MRDRYQKLGMWAEYKFWRNQVKKVLDESKSKFYRNMIKDSKDSTIWTCIHSLNPANPTRPYELVNESNYKLTDPNEIADAFNSFFTSCVQNLRTNSLQQNKDFDKLSEFVSRNKPENEVFFLYNPSSAGKLCV